MDKHDLKDLKDSAAVEAISMSSASPIAPTMLQQFQELGKPKRAVLAGKQISLDYYRCCAGF